jgi:phage terminase large subunit
VPDGATIVVPKAFGFLYGGSARYRAAFGGRGSGKSHQFAQACLVRAAVEPLRVLCCREVQNSIRDSVKRLLDDKIEASPQLKGFYSSTDAEIRGRNGSLIAFVGLRNNIESIKSKEGFDIAWVEEAATVSQRSLDLLTPTIRKDDSELWFTWNPRYPTDPVDRLFRGDNAPPSAVVREIHWYDNPWFPPALRKDMRWDRQRDPDKYNHVWLGAYLRNSASRVFTNWSILDLKPPLGTRFYYGADWGFSTDPTVLVRCWIYERTLCVDYEAYAVGCEIDQTPALFRRVPGAAEWPIRADSARPETISYMQRNGFPKMVPASKGAGSVEDGIALLKSYDIVVHPRCQHTIDELSMYSWKTDSLTGEILPQLEDKKNHIIDSLRYSLELLRNKKLPVWGAV